MQSVEPDFDKRTVCCDDFFVMATDGVTDVLDTDRGNEIFSLCDGFCGTAQELSDAILKRAIERSGGVASDDMTVAVCKVLKNS
jgi:serine/threonine protein phosphatase PrpC